MQIVTVYSTDAETHACAHAYGEEWLVVGAGFELRVCGAKLPKYLAKRLDTAIDTGGVASMREDAVFEAAAVAFTEVEVAQFRAAAE